MAAPETIRQSRRLPRAKAGQPVILRVALQNILLGVCEGVMNLRVYQKQFDSAGTVIPAKQAEVTLGDGSLDIILPATTAGSSSGDTWPSVELDPRQSIPTGAWRYVSPQSALAQTGLMDLVGGVVVAAVPGLWRATQNVPAQVTVSGVVKYNVPQPIPQLGAPSGTPLKGDADSSTVFWVRIEKYSAC